MEKQKTAKEQLRKQLLLKRNALPEKERELCGRNLVKTICKLPWYQESKQIFCYCSIGSELPTQYLLKQILSDSKELYLPRVNNFEGSMDFFRVTVLSQLQEGYFHIPEPNESCRIYTHIECICPLILVPGLGFDRNGNRIGYGKGFYDSYFSAHSKLISKTIGIGYAFQLLDNIPSTENDICLKKIICIE